MTERDAKDLLDNLSVPVIIVKAVFNDKKEPTDFRVVYVNKQYDTQTKGFAKPGNSIVELKSILPQEIDWQAVCRKVLAEGGCYEDDYLTLRLHVWFHMKVQKYGDDMCVFTLSNVTAVKVKERHLEFLEMNDEKTGMPNSLSFSKSLEEEIKKAEQNQQLVGLIIMNIDNMQTINDFTSREAGDAVIQKSAVILLNLECGSVHTFRLEGDEFALIKSNAVSISNILEIADTILSEFCRNGISVSMGIALYPMHDVQARSLIKDADLAMHHVKNNKKGSYALFKVEMYEEFLSNIQIQKKIVTGLEHHQFMLYYQPQFYLNGKKLRGFEALIRWRDETGEWHAPSSFIPIAERTNTIQILGKWVIENAVAQLKQWQENYDFRGILSVNVSPVQLKSPLFVKEVKSIVEQYKILPQTLELEITEGIFISDTEKTAEMLGELQQLGIRISLDDFGTGYSSLRYLGSMPINTLKLDKSFVDGIQQGNEINIEILSSLIPVTRHAGLETIAEGVEQPEQLSILMDIECNTVQGFLWGKPISAEKCDRFLKGDESALEKL
jgi:diguanylate cyclase (GGDEF)-like protein